MAKLLFVCCLSFFNCSWLWLAIALLIQDRLFDVAPSPCTLALFSYLRILHLLSFLFLLIPAHKANCRDATFFFKVLKSECGKRFSRGSLIQLTQLKKPIDTDIRYHFILRNNVHKAHHIGIDSNKFLRPFELWEHFFA